MSSITVRWRQKTLDFSVSGQTAEAGGLDEKETGRGDKDRHYFEDG